MPERSDGIEGRGSDALVTRRVASRVAASVFAVVFVAALVLVSIAFVAGSGANTGVATTDRSTVVTQPDSSPSAVVTTEHSSVVTTPQATWIDKVLNPAVVFLLEIGAALVAAFAAAAAAQRVLLGSYAFSLGPLSVPEIPKSEVERPGNRAIEAIASQLPGGGTTGGRDALTAGITLAPADVATPPPLLPASDDPNLELVALRIEIERRVVNLATAAGLQADGRSLKRLVSDLTAAEAIPITVAASLTELINLGNSAAHGANVSPDAGAWARSEGPRLLRALDALIANTSDSDGRPSDKSISPTDPHVLTR